MASEPVDHPWFASGLPVILAVGRLDAQKNHGLLLRAFSLLPLDLNARLLIVGEGPCREALTAEIRALGLESTVQLLGEDVNPFRFMARANCFVLSSNHEGLPGVLIEAMACGVPVVSTDCPTGPREPLEDGRWGLLVPLKIQWLLPTLSRSFSHAALILVEGACAHTSSVWIAR